MKNRYPRCVPYAFDGRQKASIRCEQMIRPKPMSTVCSRPMRSLLAAIDAGTEARAGLSGNLDCVCQVVGAISSESIGGGAGPAARSLRKGHVQSQQGK